MGAEAHGKGGRAGRETVKALSLSLTFSRVPTQGTGRKENVKKQRCKTDLAYPTYF